jgi:hypothetical protein
MIESQQVIEWMAMGEAKGEARGEARGEIKGEIKALLGVLAELFPPGAPHDLESTIQTTNKPDQLQSWIRLAVKSRSLEEFRQAAGL